MVKSTSKLRIEPGSARGRLDIQKVLTPSSALGMTENALAVIGWQTLGAALVNLREKALEHALDPPPPGDANAAAADAKAQASSFIACRKEREKLSQILDDLLHGDVFPKYVTLLCALVEVEQHAWGGNHHLWDDFAQLRRLLEQANHLVVMCKAIKKWEIARASMHCKQLAAVRCALERFGEWERLEEARAAHAAVLQCRGAAATAVSLIDGHGGKAAAAAAAGAPVAAAAAAAAAAVPDVFQDFHGLLPEVEAALKREQRTGVVGLAGVGKTAIARRVFDRVKGRFAGCAVFVTVGREPDLRVLLRHAAAAVLPGKKLEFTSAEQGREEIAHELSRQELHTLLVLDDVWHQEHAAILDFATQAAATHQDSRLLVTTRHDRVLRNADGSTILDNLTVLAVPTLCAEHAAELLRTHALAGGAATPAGGDGVLAALAAACMPVPLALQQVGAAVAGRGLDEWREVLRRVEEAAGPDGDAESATLQQCKLSYDMLPPALQECFLHCAAYPEAMAVPHEELQALWAAQAPLPCEEAHTRAAMQLQELLRRRMIMRDEAGACVVHDVMWQIACGEASTRGGFMYMTGGVVEGGDDASGRPAGGGGGGKRGVRPGTVAPERSATLTQRARSLWPRRRSADEAPVLHVSVTPGGALSSRLPTAKASQLRTLVHLRCGNAAVLGEATACSSLRFLSLTGGTLSALPDSIGDLRMLEALVLRGCKKLKNLPDRIGDCTQLRLLDVAACCALRALPECLGSLAALHTLVLRGCTALRELPAALAGLTALRTLSARECAVLATVPEGIGSLQRLQTLDLAQCVRLMGMPEQLSQAVCLEVLKLDGCAQLLSLPAGLGALKVLRTLSMARCTGITELPDTISDCTELQTLTLHGCTGLAELPEQLGDLGLLQKLDVSGCSALTVLPERLGDLTSLEVLHASSCTKLAAVPERIGDCGCLRELRLVDCAELTALPERIGELKALQELDLEMCEGLHKLPETLCDLAGLQGLNLKWCKALMALPERLGGLQQLRRLNVERCYALPTLPDSMSGLQKLTSLNLKWCKMMTVLPAELGKLQKLESLNLTWCKSVKALPDDVGDMTSLQTLVLERCYAVTALPDSVCKLRALMVLNLKWCKSLAALPDCIGKLEALRSLNLAQCGALPLDEIARVQAQAPRNCVVETSSCAMAPQE
eukprot:jgi/Ulvmu1/6563/UM003_0200.1